eukprot:2772896-Prymnesium_polylepis.1
MTGPILSPRAAPVRIDPGAIPPPNATSARKQAVRLSPAPSHARAPARGSAKGLLTSPALPSRL